MGNSIVFSNSSLDVVSGLIKIALLLFALPLFWQVMKSDKSHVYLASLVSWSCLGSQHPRFSLPLPPSPPFSLSLYFLSLSLSLSLYLFGKIHMIIMSIFTSILRNDLTSPSQAPCAFLVPLYLLPSARAVSCVSQQQHKSKKRMANRYFKSSKIQVS